MCDLLYRSSSRASRRSASSADTNGLSAASWNPINNRTTRVRATNRQHTTRGK